MAKETYIQSYAASSISCAANTNYAQVLMDMSVSNIMSILGLSGVTGEGKKIILKRVQIFATSTCALGTPFVEGIYITQSNALPSAGGYGTTGQVSTILDSAIGGDFRWEELNSPRPEGKYSVDSSSQYAQIRHAVQIPKKILSIFNDQMQSGESELDYLSVLIIGKSVAANTAKTLCYDWIIDYDIQEAKITKLR